MWSIRHRRPRTSPTPAHIMAELHAAADDPVNHRYPESEGLPELSQAIFGFLFSPFRDSI